ncbi:unnamed protein product [Rotaria magnacalcarata]|uniref:Aspergillus nuclease S(1) n=1 Tax=Rotaria magnacalcarata TaxID=392030 RepID=A0A816KEZ4_9BILA|nr:unnamed protein product [Rotaria magnacalcarata]
MLSSSLLMIICFYGTAVQNVYGWGAVGHNLVASLAQSQLTAEAFQWVKSLVPWYLSGNLTAVATWADNILYPDTNLFDHPNWQWSRQLHYLNTPSWVCSYDPSRDCINDTCIEGALRNYSKRVIDPNLDDIQHKEALMFLVHYVGDVHQPLHVSFQTDLGGNSIKGYFMNQTFPTNLHSLWDSGLISIRLSRDYGSNITSYYEHIYSLMLAQGSTSNNEDFIQWIQESLQHVCQQVYLDESNMIMNASVKFTLGNIYYERNIGIIEQRLAQGGRRLGTLLNRLATDSLTISSRCEKLCSNMNKLIMLICILARTLMS